MAVKQIDYRNVLGDPLERGVVIDAIERDAETYRIFQKLSEVLQEELIAFCMGNWGLKITYDPFFKYVFNPELKPERLSDFLSRVIKEDVEVVDILPNESNRITEAGTLLITDILVRLSSGAYANVEIQKIGYTFPGQRCACYSADLLMRQLSRAKKEAKKENKKFSYKNVKKVYTIVLIEKSASIYWEHPDHYIHRAKQVFDTGLNMDLLQEYIIIPLDVFREINHNELNKLEAWLYFIGSDSPKDISRVVEAYPEFKELYNELLMLRYNVKELVEMYDYYRELLREADEEAVEYMVEEQRKEIEELKAERVKLGAEITAQKNEITAQKNEITAQKNEITAQNEVIATKDKEIATKDEEIFAQKEEIKRLKALLAKKQIFLDEED